MCADPMGLQGMMDIRARKPKRRHKSVANQIGKQAVVDGAKAVMMASA